MSKSKIKTVEVNVDGEDGTFLPGIWLVPAHNIDPEVMREEILGEIAAGRIAGEELAGGMIALSSVADYDTACKHIRYCARNVAERQIDKDEINLIDAAARVYVEAMTIAYPHLADIIDDTVSGRSWRAAQDDIKRGLAMTAGV